MKKIAVLLAAGFEECEVVVPVDVWRRMGYDVTLVSTGDGPAVTGAHGMTLTADAQLGPAAAENWDAVVCPGGMPGSRNLRDNPAVLDLIQKVYRQGGITAAICAAPMVLNRAGLLDGRRFTAYPGMDGEFAPNRPDSAAAVQDGQVVTGRGPGAAFAFARAVATALGGEDAVRTVLTGMLVD